MRRIQLLGAADAVMRAWWKIVAGVCAGLIAAVAVLHFSSKQYEANAHLLATPVELESSITAETLRTQLASVAQAALSRPRSQGALAEALGIDPDEVSLGAALASVRTRLHVSVTTRADNPDANEVLVSYRDSDPETAARLTNTLAGLLIAENSRSDPTATAVTAETRLHLEFITEAAAPRRPIRPRAIPVYLLGCLLGPTLLFLWVCGRRMLSPILDTMASFQEASEIRVLVGIPQIAKSAPGSSGRGARAPNQLYSAISVTILALVMLIWA